jgi:cytochrome c553
MIRHTRPFYVSDTEKGRVWRIIYTGDTTPVASRAHAPTASDISTNLIASIPTSPEARLFGLFCATCHMADGNGVANMNAPLRGSQVVAGDPKQLIRVVLESPEKVLPAERMRYSNRMPPMNVLKDQEIATILTYIRHEFGGNASAIEPSQVAAVRSQIKTSTDAK